MSVSELIALALQDLESSGAEHYVKVRDAIARLREALARALEGELS